MADHSTNIIDWAAAVMFNIINTILKGFNSGGTHISSSSVSSRFHDHKQNPLIILTSCFMHNELISHFNAALVICLGRGGGGIYDIRACSKKLKILYLTELFMEMWVCVCVCVRERERVGISQCSWILIIYEEHIWHVCGLMKVFSLWCPWLCECAIKGDCIYG